MHQSLSEAIKEEKINKQKLAKKEKEYAQLTETFSKRLVQVYKTSPLGVVELLLSSDEWIYSTESDYFFNKLLKEFNMPSQKVWMGGEEDVGWVIGHPDIGPLVDNRFNIIQFDTREEAEEYFLNNTGFSSDAPREDWGVAPYSSLPEVWQQRITDEMREKFKEGMSLTKREDTGLLGSYA